MVAQIRHVVPPGGASEASRKRYISVAQRRGFVVREKHWRPVLSKQGDR